MGDGCVGVPWPPTVSASPRSLLGVNASRLPGRSHRLREPPGKVIDISRAVSPFVARLDDISSAVVDVAQETAVGIGNPDEISKRIMLKLGVSAGGISNSLQLGADVGQSSDEPHRICDSNQPVVSVIAIASCISVPIHHRRLKAQGIETNSSTIFERAGVSAVGVL